MGERGLPFRLGQGHCQTPSDVSIPIEFAFNSHYDVLGVPRDASVAEAKAACFRVRRIYTIRAAQGDPVATDRLQQINRALEMLTKPAKRAAYDRTAEAIFLSIADPTPTERVTRSTGLRLIHEDLLTNQSLAFDDVENQDAVTECPNALLDQLLK